MTSNEKRFKTDHTWKAYIVNCLNSKNGMCSVKVFVTQGRQFIHEKTLRKLINMK